MTSVPVDPAAISFDMPVMIVSALALAAMLLPGSVVSRTEGLVLLA